MKQSRFASRVAWLTLLPVLVLLGDAYGLWNVIGMSGDTFQKVYMGILTAAVAFGLFNNPESANKF